MRTTVNLDPEVLAAAKRRAREQGTPISSFIEGALRHALAGHARPPGPGIPVVSGTGLNPGVDVDSTRDLQDLLDGADRDGADA